MKVLVVDDETLVRLSLKRALMKRGHEVFEAVDGADALDKWAGVAPELVFLDVLMPKASGPEVLRGLAADVRAPAKVILMSAFSGEYNLEKAKLMGADMYVPKPFDDVFAVVRLAEELNRDR